MMNVDNKDMDLGLSLSISNLNVQTRWENNNSGAGVNAGSRVETTFGASDPLKELVWSPENGPSLKCAGHSFAGKIYSFQWDVEPSNVVCSPSHSIISKGTKDKKCTREVNQVASQGTSYLNNEVSRSASLGQSSRRSAASIIELSHSQKGQGDQRTANLLPLLNDEPKPGTEKEVHFPAGETEDVDKDHQGLGLDIALSSKIHIVEQCDTLDSPLQDLSSPGRRNMELALIVKDGKNINGPTSGNDVDKIEATAENDIQQLISRDTYEPSEKKGQRSEIWKGKEKEKYSWDKEVDESHGSMESCNSAKLFSNLKRRWSFDHQFIVGSKRIKRQIQESPSSNSLVKQNSSFMNWISKMVKGLAKSSEEDGSASFPSHEGCDPNITPFNTTREGCSRKMGFESVFQSIYLPSRKVKETRTPLENYPGDISKELALACKSSGGVMPVSCHGEKMHLPNHTTKQSAFRNIGGPSSSTQLKNERVTNPACKKEKFMVSPSNSSQGEKESPSIRGNSTDPSAEGKPNNQVGNLSTTRGSLWITRYSHKVPFDVSNLDQCNKNALRVNCFISPKSSELSKSSTDLLSKGLQNCVPNTESSISFNKNGGNKRRTFVKQKSSESLKSPDEMTSLFARRLDALKHISSVALRDDSSQTRRENCFFCGKSGHKMQDCSDIQEMELECLLRNSSLYEDAEETPFLCIKCFQLDHWAASCPLSGSKRCSSLRQREEKSRSKLDFTGSPGKGQKRSVFSEKGNINLVEIQKHVAPSREKNDIQNKQLTSPIYNIATEQISAAPNGVFDTVRKLRLTRTNVLKWMNSHFSDSNLDGYFLRLRLGKWKEGPGGAGYYVACITGSPREKSPKGFKKHIYVTVGGVECVVESQYVSNQDFQEDELMAWWNKARGSVRIPAEADLKVKLEERKRLGF